MSTSLANPSSPPPAAPPRTGLALPGLALPELALPGLGSAVRRRPSRQVGRVAARAGGDQTGSAVPLASENPVAQVLVDLPQAHLDRAWDYAVPEAIADSARPGVRVKVRFAGRLVDGFLLARLPRAERARTLSPLARVVSPEPVLSPAVAELVAAVAERYAGSRADVLRLAVPPRHASTERKESAPAPPPGPSAAPWRTASAAAAWEGHGSAAAFLGHLAEGRSPRAVWSAAPGADWPLLLANAAAATYASGRGVLVCVPDAREADRVSAALEGVLGPGHHVQLRADAGPAARYRDFLALARGARRVVVGTRAAAFAPVADLGLVAIWDDGDDLHAERRAPYPHARETLLLRAELEGTAALLGGFARSVEADHLLRRGWAREIAPSRALVRERVRVSVSGASDRELARDPGARAARLPRTAHDAIRRGLEAGPVLVQTPRGGYAPALACASCRGPARCLRCRGPLRLGGAGASPECRWCGQAEPAWVCPGCAERRLRAPVLGEERTAEELSRAFPGVPVRRSGGSRALATVPDEPALVVATPGAEPVAESGYAAVVLLDTWLLLSRPDLRAGEEALRRWLGAAGMARPGGHVVAVGDPASAPVQALVRWDPAGYARREADDRRSARMPPASRLATLTGSPGAVGDALIVLDPPPGTEVLGPVPTGRDDEVRALLRAPVARTEELSAALGELQRVRSARKLDPVRVQVDPSILG